MYVSTGRLMCTLGEGGLNVRCNKDVCMHVSGEVHLLY